MEILIVLGVIAAIVIRKVIGDSHARTNDAWSAAAARLGLNFRRAALFKPKLLRGVFQGNDIDVSTYTRSAGKSRKTFTRYRVLYPMPLGLGLNLSEQRFFSSIAAIFGSQDIETGDINFDEKVVVKGNQPENVLRFLTPRRRRQVLDLLNEFPQSKINDEQVEWLKSGTVRDAAEIVDTVTRLSSAATILYEGEPAQESSREEPEPAQSQAPIAEPTAEPIGEPNREAILEVVDGPTANVDIVQMESIEDFIETSLAGEAAVAETAATDGLAAETVCSVLFQPSVMSHEAKQRFDAEFKDQTVRWSGVLKRVSAYRIDLTFTDGPGTKATFDLSLNDTSGISRAVQAIVQLPQNAEQALRRQVGERLDFEGRLANCDSLLRSFQITNGRVL